MKFASLFPPVVRDTARSVRNLPVRTAQWRHDRNGEFVFIHINKTGGSSIETALGVPLDHHTALQKMEHIGVAAWNERFTFSFVRNPWDRTVSHFHHRKGLRRKGLESDDIEFGDWVRAVYVDRDPLYRNSEQQFMPQIDWLTGGDGSVLVDRIFRFERIAEDFAELMTILGRDNELPHRKASNRTAYTEYYDDETVAIIGEAFAPDIDRFGYNFGESHG